MKHAYFDNGDDSIRTADNEYEAAQKIRLALEDYCDFGGGPERHVVTADGRVLRVHLTVTLAPEESPERIEAVIKDMRDIKAGTSKLAEFDFDKVPV